MYSVYIYNGLDCVYFNTHCRARTAVKKVMEMWGDQKMTSAIIYDRSGSNGAVARHDYGSWQSVTSDPINAIIDNL